MIAKEILYGAEARQKIIAGVNKLANAVKVTLGGQGRNVIVAKNMREPYATKDGVTVANEVFLKDPLENVGAQILKQAARKTADQAGDGTTTSTILAQGLINRLSPLMDKFSPVQIKEVVNRLTAEAVKSLQEHSTPISDDKAILNVATISANNDTEIGTLVADAVKRVGHNGIVTHMPSTNLTTTVTVSEGFRLPAGFENPAFVNNQHRRLCEYADALVLLYEKKITSMKDLMPILEIVHKQGQGRPLLIMAEDYEPVVMATLCVNSIKGLFKACAVKLPGRGDLRKELLLDIAAVTNATIISPERDKLKLADAELKHLGVSQKVIVDKDSTLLVNDNKAAVEARIQQLKSQAHYADEPGLKEHLNERIAVLSGGIAVIKVGGLTAIEVSERNDRVDDAIRATQAALEEGILPGGGSALAWFAFQKNHNYSTGIEKAFLETLLDPLKQQLVHAGSADIAIGKAIDDLRSQPFGTGYNVMDNCARVPMVDAGIIDASKVIRCALQNAASVAIAILTCETLLVEEAINLNQQ